MNGSKNERESFGRSECGGEGMGPRISLLSPVVETNAITPGECNPDPRMSYASKSNNRKLGGAIGATEAQRSGMRTFNN